jgi:hypothetical protein
MHVIGEAYLGRCVTMTNDPELRRDHVESLRGSKDRLRCHGHDGLIF